jgi:amidase
MAEAIEVLKREGAIVVDPADIPSVIDPDPDRNLLSWKVCTSMDEAKARKCSIDLAYGMERDFNLWLASLGAAAPVKTLAELRKWNTDHARAGTLKYGQSLLDFSNALDLETFKARYEADRAKDLLLTASHGIDAAIGAHGLDALVFPGSAGANVAARPGYPTVIVPFGMATPDAKPPFPEGFDPAPARLGVSFAGTACSEPRLLALAFAFERETKRRAPPPGMP